MERPIEIPIMSTQSRSIFDFSGGLYRSVDPAQLQTGQYALLTNGRTREGGITPIKLPLQVGGLPDIENMQGIYTAGNYILVFGDGQAYVRDYLNSTTNLFTKVQDFLMSPTAPIIYTCLVPTSAINFQRTLNDPEETGDKTLPIQLKDVVAGSPACIVCQDGVTQPFLIFTNGTARAAKTYEDWSNDPDGVREYVPVGKQMVYAGTKLYIAAKNLKTGNFNKLLQSVSGRPLDFVVNVTKNGDKGGDAYTTDYSPTYEDITALANISLSDTNKDGFLVSTTNRVLLVIPNTDKQVFGEPTFSNQPVFSSTGALNNTSIIEDLLGDTTLIDATGIRSFNAVQQTKLTGQNTPFSLAIQPLFGDNSQVSTTIVQDKVASIEFENYGIFSVKTIYGYKTLFYDSIRQQFIAIDDYSSVIGENVAIKQWAAIKTNVARALFFLTDDNKIYQSFAGNTATCSIYIGDFVPSPNETQQIPISLTVNLLNVKESGTLNASLYIDSANLANLSSSIVQEAETPSASPYLTFPFGNTDNLDRIRNIPFGSFKGNPSGWKAGFYLTWDFQATLIGIKYEANFVEVDNASAQSRAKTYSDVLAM